MQPPKRLKAPEADREQGVMVDMVPFEQKICLQSRNSTQPTTQVCMRSPVVHVNIVDPSQGSGVCTVISFDTFLFQIAFSCRNTTEIWTGWNSGGYRYCTYCTMYTDGTQTCTSTMYYSVRIVVYVPILVILHY